MLLHVIPAHRYHHAASISILTTSLALCARLNLALPGFLQIRKQTAADRQSLPCIV